MRRRLANPRLTVAERAALLADAAAGLLSTGELGKKYDVSTWTVRDILKKAGVVMAHGHGGGRSGAGRHIVETPEDQRIVETPEMVWVSALARAYALGLSKGQYGALAKRYPFLKGKRLPPGERLRLLGVLYEEFYPLLEGLHTGNRDMGDDFQRMVQGAFVAVSAEEPVATPFVDEDVLRGFEEQVAVGELIAGGRRLRPSARPMDAGDPEFFKPSTFWGAAGTPVPEELRGGPVTKREFEKLVEERTRLLEEGEADLETMEAEAGVRHIDPAAYLEAQALRDELEAIRKKERLAREIAGATGAKRRPKRPPTTAEKRRESILGNPGSRREDTAATALAGLWLRRAASGFKLPKQRQARKKRPRRRESKSALFRRMMRI